MQGNIASSEDMTIQKLGESLDKLQESLGYNNIYCLIDRYGIGYVGETRKNSDYAEHFLNKKRSLVRHGYTYDKRLSTMMNGSEFKKIILKKSLIKSFEFDDMNNSLRIEGSNDTYITYNGHEALGDLDYFSSDKDLWCSKFEQIGLSTANYIGMTLRNKKNATSSYSLNELNDLISLPFLFEITKKSYYKNRELEISRLRLLETKIKQLMKHEHIQ
jgi:hypothetical protein